MESPASERAPVHAATREVGFVHSYTMGSTVDGPGVRMVVWLSGCHFRCAYCHNPDTWKVGAGMRTTLEELLDEVERYRKFLRFTAGGMTVSGGEPLVQAPFAMQLLRECQARGIHTALDTNGFLGDRIADGDLDAADLYLLDLKSGDPETHRRVTGCDLEPVVRFARRLSRAQRPMWLRFVLVPGLTDTPDNIARVADLAAELESVERVEVLPFHQLGALKWEQLGQTYTLSNTRPPEPEAVAQAVELFRARGLNVS